MMRKLLATVATAALVLSACGGSGGSSGGGGSPKETLTNALEGLSSGGHTFKISLDSDAASLSKLSEGDLSEDVAQKILDSSLSVSSVSADDPKDSEFAMVANVAGSDDVEIRYVDQTLYLRVDLDSLLNLAGADAKASAQAQIQALVQQAKAQGLDFVEPAVNGEWLAFTGLGAILDQLGANASPTDQQEAIVKQFTDSVTKDATVTSEGNEDPGEHLVATVNVKDLYQSFVDLADQLGQGAASSLQTDESQIPDKDVKADFWVDDGKVTQIELDILQLAQLAPEGDQQIPEGVDHFGVKMEVSDFSGGVEVPSGAHEVDLSQLMQAFTGGGSTSSGSGSSGSSEDAFCNALKSQPASIQKQYADMCPNL